MPPRVQTEPITRLVTKTELRRAKDGKRQIIYHLKTEVRPTSRRVTVWTDADRYSDYAWPELDPTVGRERLLTRLPLDVLFARVGKVYTFEPDGDIHPA
jgi:hypothetical protein